MEIIKLFEPYTMGDFALANRFVLPPLTRSRSSLPGEVPNALMATYYAQRASAGFLIAEATQVSLQGMGYARTPGVYSAEQIEGWKLVTEAVHKQGRKIFLQLWHTGRVGSSKVNGLQPMAPSPIGASNTSVYIFDGAPNGDATFVPVEQPREMDLNDIETVISEFVQGAKNAIAAGFDGVEIHGANGYLVDQFLRSNSNKRTDEYGGTKEKRTRFVVELTEAVANAVGKERTGLRIAPFIKFKDMDDPEILDTMKILIDKINALDILYLHLSEADWDDAPQIPRDFRLVLRQKFLNTIIATGNKTPEQAELLLKEKLVDLVGFGRKFLANPDYPERVKRNAPLNQITDTHTLFGGGDSRGYTDYPCME